MDELRGYAALKGDVNAIYAVPDKKDMIKAEALYRQDQTAAYRKEQEGLLGRIGRLREQQRKLRAYRTGLKGLAFAAFGGENYERVGRVLNTIENRLLNKKAQLDFLDRKYPRSEQAMIKKELERSFYEAAPAA